MLDPGLKGGQDRSTGEWLMGGRQPDERVQRRVIPSSRQVVQPSCTIRLSQRSPAGGSRSIRAAISPGITSGRGFLAAPAPRRLVPLQFSLLPPKGKGGWVKRGAAPLPVMDENRILPLMPVIMQGPFPGLAQARTPGRHWVLMTGAGKPGGRDRCPVRG